MTGTSVCRVPTPDPTTAARALAAEAATLRVVGILQAASIEPVVMKGPLLARRLYGAAAARGVPVDVDVLVHREEVAGAIEALSEAGLVAPPPAEVAALLRTSHELPLRAGADVREAAAARVVDLHWSPWSVSLYPPAGPAIARHLEQLELAGVALTVFDRPLTIVHLAAQYTQGGFTEHRLLRDLGTAWERWAPEAGHEAVALGDEAGLRDVLAYSLEVASRLGFLGSSPAALPGSRRARRLAVVAPRGRPEALAPEPDYLGQLLALGLVPPRRALGRLRRALFVPRPLMGPGSTTGGGVAARRSYMGRVLRLAGGTVRAGAATRPGVTRSATSCSTASPTSRTVRLPPGRARR